MSDVVTITVIVVLTLAFGLLSLRYPEHTSYINARGNKVTDSHVNPIWLSIAVTLLTAAILTLVQALVQRPSYEDWLRVTFTKPVEDAAARIDQSRAQLVESFHSAATAIVEARTRFDRTSDNIQSLVADNSAKLNQAIDILNLATTAGLSAIHAHADSTLAADEWNKLLRQPVRVIGICRKTGFWVKVCPDGFRERIENDYDTYIMLDEFNRIPDEELGNTNASTSYTAVSVFRVLSLAANDGRSVQFLSVNLHDQALLFDGLTALVSPYGPSTPRNSNLATPLLKYESVPHDQHSYFARIADDVDRLLCPNAHGDLKVTDLRTKIADERDRLIAGSEMHRILSRWLDAQPLYDRPFCATCQSEE